jgi:hypothetical protein
MTVNCQFHARIASPNRPRPRRRPRPRTLVLNDRGRGRVRGRGRYDHRVVSLFTTVS